MRIALEPIILKDQAFDIGQGKQTGIVEAHVSKSALGLRLDKAIFCPIGNNGEELEEQVYDIKSVYGLSDMDSETYEAILKEAYKQAKEST